MVTCYAAFFLNIEVYPGKCYLLDKYEELPLEWAPELININLTLFVFVICCTET